MAGMTDSDAAQLLACLDDAPRLPATKAPRAPREPADRAARLAALLDEFVRVFAGNRQRGAAWYAEMGVTVGGSEMAAVMGLDPYKTLYDVVARKVAELDGTRAWDEGSEACWWGTLFEDVAGAYVEVDLGAAVRGDEICIQAVAGHRNSPDGFVVARLYRGVDGRRRVWTTDMPPDVQTASAILLLEFKCPLVRKPRGDVPAHYRPQVWSGLAVAPVADAGLFVDAVFRKCGLLDLGDTPEYDAAYHARDAGRGPDAKAPDWKHPLAWGLVGVYAPLLDAPRHVRLGWRGAEWAPGDPLSEAPDSDAALAAWEIHAAYFGQRPRAGAPLERVDFGGMEARLFGRSLGLVNRRRFPVCHAPPCFADGRGAGLHSGAEVGRAIAALGASAPPHHWLLGVLPWKLLEVDYVPVERRPGFLGEIEALVENVHQTVADARASGDAAAFLAAHFAGKGSAVKQAGRSAAVGEDDIQSLFDSLSGPAAAADPA